MNDGQHMHQIHFGGMGNNGMMVSDFGAGGQHQGQPQTPNDFMGWISQAMGTSFGNVFQGASGNGLNAGDFVFVSNNA